MNYRKIVKQGIGAHTITLPKNWIKKNNLTPGDNIKIEKYENNLIISCDKKNYEILKSIEINLENNSHQGYRSIIGALYRQGFDEIKIIKNNLLDFTELEISINSIFGLEIFDDKKHYIIKNIFSEEKTQIKPHIQRIIFSIQNMQEIIENDLNEKKFNSKEKITSLRNNILKQRDLILRIIKKNNYNEDEIFPYYNIALSLWGVTRGYYHMYLEIDKSDLEYIKILKKTNNYFNLTYNNSKKNSFKDINIKYKIYSEITKELKLNLKKTIIASFCLNIMQEIQLSDSNIVLINEKLI